jgi:hypothetical protein
MNSDSKFEILEKAMNSSVQKIKEVFNSFFQDLLFDVFFLSKGPENNIFLWKKVNFTLSFEQLPIEQLAKALNRPVPKDQTNSLDEIVLGLFAVRDDDKYIYQFFQISSLHFSDKVYLIAIFNRNLWAYLPNLEFLPKLGSTPPNLAQYIFWILQHRCLKDICNIDQPHSSASLLTVREIHEHAASWLLNDLVKQISKNECINLFDQINQIARSMYENKSSNGRFIFLEPIPLI